MLGEPGPASHPPTAQAPKTTAMAPAEVGEGAGAAGAELGDGDAKSGLSPWLLLIPAAVIVLLVGAFFFLKTSDDPQPVAAPSASPSKSRPVSEPSKSQTGSTNSNSGSSSSGSSGSGSSGVAAPAQPTPKVWTPPPHQSHQKPANASVIKLDKSTWDGTMNGGRYEYTMNISEGSGGSLSAVMYRRNAKTGKDGYQTLTGSISGDTVTLNGQSWQNAPRSWTTDQITVKVSEGEATRVMQGTYTCTGCKGSSDIKGYQDFS